MIAAIALQLAVAAAASAQMDPLRVNTCDATLAPLPALQVEDEASSLGATIENIALAVLPNGLRSLRFSVRNARTPNPFGTVLKVHYTVQWTDDCGRHVANGRQPLDDLFIDPHRRKHVQLVARDPHATHALLRVRVEN